jgi:PAS domain S-box-containing protein
MEDEITRLRRQVVVLKAELLRLQASEEALRRSEAIFDSFMAHCPLYVFFKDEKARSIRLSRNYEQMLGRPVEELLGKTMDELFPSDLAKGMIADDLRVMREGRPIEVVEEFNGRVFETLKFPIIRPNRPPLLAGFTIDITERRQAEEVLRQSELSAKRQAERDAVIAEIGRVISSSLNIEDVYERFAAEVKKIIPFDRIGINLVDFDSQTASSHYMFGPPVEGRMEGDPFPLAGTATAMAVASGRGLVIPTLPETELARRIPGHLPLRRAGLKSSLLAPLISKGEAFGALVMMSAEPDKYSQRDIQIAENVAGQISGAIANALLLRERQAAEEALKESEAKYRLIVENQTDLVVKVDADGRILFVSPSYCETFGRTEQELLGSHFMPQVHEEDRSATAEALKKLRQPPHTSYVERRAMTRSGWRWFGWAEKALLDEEGKVSAVIRVGRDVTERKRMEAERRKMEAQFRQAQKMESVGRLAGGVAHDFNNMLSVILGYTDMALLKLTARDPIYHDLCEVKSAAKRSADLTRQLLAFARKQAIAPQILDLNETVAGMLKMLARLIGEDIKLIWQPGADLEPVKMDPAQVDQILANLAVNARDAIDGQGRLTIQTGMAEFDEHFCSQHRGAVPGSYVMLAVGDDGCGMERETLERLFEPFFTTKEVGKGTGLGLATVYGIVKQNQGFITVASEPGQGTTFTIYLPRREAAAAAAEEPPAPVEEATGTETVLLVEDEEALLRFSRILIERLGYTVLAASSPHQAIRLGEEHDGEIHLLVTDVVMPEMSGRDLWKKIKALRPEIRCLFMSGYANSAIVHRGVLDQGVHFLQKPFSTEALSAKLREALSAR